MLPIEKGCLAIIVNSEAGNNGKVVTVGGYIGNVIGWKYGGRWEIDREIKGIFGTTFKHVSDRKLMRIDGYKEETKQKTEVVR